MFQVLTKYLHELPQGRYGRWVLDRTHDGSAQQPIELPFVDYTEAVDAFIIDVFQFAKEHPELGLDDYRVILAEHHIKPGVKSMAEAGWMGVVYWRCWWVQCERSGFAMGRCCTCSGEGAFSVGWGGWRR